jgi:hypothetical protein
MQALGMVVDCALPRHHSCLKFSAATIAASCHGVPGTSFSCINQIICIIDCMCECDGVSPVLSSQCQHRAGDCCDALHASAAIRSQSVCQASPE